MTGAVTRVFSPHNRNAFPPAGSLMSSVGRERYGRRIVGDIRDLKNAKIDRRSMIKKTAVGVGVAWTAPMVLSSAASGTANTETCYFVKRDAGTDNCNGTDPSNGACTEIITTSDGCGVASLLAFTVSVSTASATVSKPCYIKEMQVKAGMDCNRVTYSGTDTLVATVTTADSPDNRDISHVSVVWCCPTSGTLDLD